MFNPKYSYEFNQVLNPEMDENDLVKNFASLITDKDRLFILLEDLNKNKKDIEKHLGFNFPENVDFYIVRAEKFNSFSDPITIEYKLEPEIMIINTLKEAIKVHLPVRFPDDKVRDEMLDDFISFMMKKIDDVKYTKYITENKTNFEEINFENFVRKFFDDNPDFIEGLYKENKNLQK